jgi:hypothetical protein
MALKLLQLLSAALLIAVIASPSASAGTIDVHGSLNYTGFGDSGIVSLIGDRGFTFSGIADRPFGTVLAAADGSPYLPGTTVSLRVVASASDLEGHATLDGIVYPDIGFGPPCPGVEGCGSGLIELAGGVVAPPFGQSSTAILVAPVTFLGTFFFFDSHSVPISSETLRGSGTATLTLDEINGPVGPLWAFDNVRYDLATPEPTTLLLLGTATMGLGWVARRRRHARR